MPSESECLDRCHLSPATLRGRWQGKQVRNGAEVNGKTMIEIDDSMAETSLCFKVSNGMNILFLHLSKEIINKGLGKLDSILLGEVLVHQRLLFLRTFRAIAGWISVPSIFLCLADFCKREVEIGRARTQGRNLKS